MFNNGALAGGTQNSENPEHPKLCSRPLNPIWGRQKGHLIWSGLYNVSRDMYLKTFVDCRLAEVKRLSAFLCFDNVYTEMSSINV